MRLTEHFTLEELTTTNHKDLAALNLTVAQENLLLIQILAEFAEKVRSVVGVPMIISSGYRCASLNKRVGGSSTSQHAKFEAIDFVPKGISIEKAIQRIQHSPLQYGQLIYEHSGSTKWVHISIGLKCEQLTFKDGKYTSGIILED